MVSRLMFLRKKFSPVFPEDAQAMDFLGSFSGRKKKSNRNKIGANRNINATP